MKRLLLLIATTFIAVMSLSAQVVTWAVKPGVYSKIEPCWEDMYFVYKGNDVGVVNGDGSVVVSPDASRITGFYGGLALVLKSEGGQERILGILCTDGSYTKVSGTYYTIPYQEFFSEGLLTVTNHRGQAAYMNGNGVIVKSFDVSFISPFSEGYAVVGENDNFTIVDKRYNALNIQLGIAQVYGGSNVYNGIAVVWDGDGKFYNFDVNRGTCKKISKPSSLDYDYLYCFSYASKRSETVPYEQPKRSSETLSVTKREDKYGYVINGKTIIPCQFDHAESFYGNYALVKVGGKDAILSLQRSDGEFSTIAVKSDIQYKKGQNNIPHVFGVSLPSKWSAEHIKVKVKDEKGISKDVTNKNGNYEFVSDGAVGSKKYNVEIESEGLKLWTGELVYNYELKKDDPDPQLPPPPRNFKEFTVSLKINNSQADKNNHCNVTATVYNPNSEDVSTLVTFSGSNLLESISRRITVPAKGTRDVSTYFTVKKAVSGQKVTVSTTAGGTDTLDGLQLIPF